MNTVANASTDAKLLVLSAKNVKAIINVHRLLSFNSVDVVSYRCKQ